MYVYNYVCIFICEQGETTHQYHSTWARQKGPGALTTAYKNEK